MAKTEEELNTLKQEYVALNNKLTELTEDELNMVTGGAKVKPEIFSKIVFASTLLLKKDISATGSSPTQDAIPNLLASNEKTTSESNK